MQFLTLSKRNLLTLLHKLVMDGSDRTLIKPGPNGPTVVSVVSDEEAYRNRAPGTMHPQTEMFIRLAAQALKVAERQMVQDQNPPAWTIKAAKALAGCDICASDNACSEIMDDAAVIRDAFFAEYGQ